MGLVSALYCTAALHLQSHFLGIVIASYGDRDELLNKRVFLVPMRGWECDPIAPEAP